MPQSNTQFYGLNKGGAQIIDTTSGAQQGFANILARQQQQRQLELKQLTDQQAQLKPDGLRNDADRQDFFNQTQNWRQKSIDAMNESDPYKKSLLKSQADQAYMGAQSTIAKSKQAATDENSSANELLQPTFSDHYQDGTVAAFNKNRQLGVNDANYVQNFLSKQEQQADHVKALDRLEKIKDAGIAAATPGTPVINTIKDPKTGQPYHTIQQTQTYDPADWKTDLSNEYDLNKNTRKTLYDVYPQFSKNPALTPQQVKDSILQQYMADSGEQSKTKQTVGEDQKPVRYSAAQLWNLRHYGSPNNPNTIIGNQLTPAQIIASNMSNGNLNDIKNHFLNLVPKGQYGDKKPDFNIDPNTGEHVFNFPEHVTQNVKNVAFNNELKKGYEKNKETTGGFLGIGGTDVPFKDSEAAKTLKPEYNTKSPSSTYRLNPNDKEAYLAQFGQMAKDQGVSTSALNQMLGGKGNRGMNSAVGAPNSTKVKKKASDYGL